jgi:hypothetical protein
MGTDQHAQPGDQHGQEHPSAAPLQGQSPGAPADPPPGQPDAQAGQFSFKTFLSGGVVALGLAFAAVGAGFSALRVIIILGSLLITSATAPRAYLAYREICRWPSDLRGISRTGSGDVHILAVRVKFDQLPSAAGARRAKLLRPE